MGSASYRLRYRCRRRNLHRWLQQRDHGTSMESIQYLQDVRYSLRVAKRNPGWEYLQDALFSIDPVRAQEDPVIVKNVPFYKAKKALEAEVTKLNPPPRPQNWGLYEKTVLLNAQREIADKILDAQWEAKWRQEKVEEMLEEKVRPFIRLLKHVYSRSLRLVLN
ncbi:hypothetical protein Bca52824_016941 [Brassica carinata]|uniref:Uncharacterized protein n=1 Tax=Brassica carinata TaxID=52824 RepID=A0A8X7VM95_BRACI|nr:hypothetical protein Bca52824_016941 [Brassica carinata]